MYSAKPTPFMLWATEHNAENVLDGLGMLVEQAAESFYIWRNVKPETKNVIEKLRTELNT
jgi:shikimate dehydrogenase